MTGKCNICGWEGEFARPEFSREGNQCRNCSATSRHRAVVYALAVALGRGDTPLYGWPKTKSMRILESSARGSYPPMLQDKFDYYGTEYDPEKIAAGNDPRSFADFQALQYDDAMFDVVIASDVFEHVRDDEAGYREIHRVLRDGGTFIMTVPYDHDRETTIRRVDTSGETDIMLLEPEYHGGGGHTLTYRNYGRDLLSLLHKSGFSVGHMEADIPGLGITHQSVMISRKGEYVHFSLAGEGASHGDALGVLLPYRLFLLVKFNLAGFVHYWKEWRRS